MRMTRKEKEEPDGLISTVYVGEAEMSISLVSSGRPAPAPRGGAWLNLREPRDDSAHRSVDRSKATSDGRGCQHAAVRIVTREKFAQNIVVDFHLLSRQSRPPAIFTSKLSSWKPKAARDEFIFDWLRRC